jgi:hypothetical protein
LRFLRAEIVEGYPKVRIELVHADGLKQVMTVSKGSPIFTITKTGITFGPHVHIQVDIGGKLWGPGIIFK